MWRREVLQLLGSQIFLLGKPLYIKQISPRFSFFCHLVSSALPPWGVHFSAAPRPCVSCADAPFACLQLTVGSRAPTDVSARFRSGPFWRARPPWSPGPAARIPGPGPGPGLVPRARAQRRPGPEPWPRPDPKASPPGRARPGRAPRQRCRARPAGAGPGQPARPEPDRERPTRRLERGQRHKRKGNRERNGLLKTPKTFGSHFFQKFNNGAAKLRAKSCCRKIVAGAHNRRLLGSSCPSRPHGKGFLAGPESLQVHVAYIGRRHVRAKSLTPTMDIFRRRQRARLRPPRSLAQGAAA